MGLNRKEMKNQAKNGQKGFTLIEVMVALGILAFGILAVASMQTASLSGTGRAQSVTEGSTFAMDRVEQLMALSYSDPALVSGSATDASGRYTINWNGTTNSPVPNTMTINVTVSWTEPGGATKSSTLTYIKMNVI
ncbi:MAG: prepilin-type N-terminal cleavage/methylation domain-containing protein [Pseudomonadota bacterium]